MAQRRKKTPKAIENITHADATRKHIPIRKATRFHLFLYLQNRVKVRNPQGIALARLDAWEDPKTEKDDDEITIYGVNSGQNVLIYNNSMTTIAVYGLNERGKKKLDAPHGITAAHWGDVYVADTGNNRIAKFHNSGKELRFQKSLLTGELLHPVGVALTTDSSLYVSDTENNRVLLIRADTVRAEIAGAGKENGKVWQPTGIAATSANDRWSYWKDDFVVVIDLFGRRIQKFDPQGHFLQAVRSEDFGYASANLQYAAIDYYGNIWVTDRKNHRIHKFDRNLNYLDSFGRKGNGDKEFEEPRGIAIHKRFGQVLIAEKASVQYYWIGTDVKNLQARRDADGFLTIDYFLTERSYVTLEVLDSRGKRITTIMKESARDAGQNQERFAGDWQPLPFVFHDGKRVFDNRRFANLPKGNGREIRLRFTFSATYSSYKYFSKKMAVRVRF
jgi:DNA-binding beta-propeller fold protein YncE